MVLSNAELGQEIAKNEATDQAEILNAIGRELIWQGKRLNCGELVGLLDADGRRFVRRLAVERQL